MNAPSATPRPVLVLSHAAFAVLLTAVGISVFVGGAWVCSKLWPIEKKP